MPTQATRIIAVRHGETAWNVDTRIQGHLDVELNDTGRWQAQQVAQALAHEDLDAIYSSDLQRAHHTALAIAGHHGQAVQTDTGLRERAFGFFEGLTFEQIDARMPEDARRWRQRDPGYVPSGGESLLMFRDRILATLQRIAVQHPGQHIPLAAHGGVMDVLYRAATGQDLQSHRSWSLGNTAINRLLWTPDGLSLVGWGDVRHLEQHQARDETTT